MIPAVRKSLRVPAMTQTVALGQWSGFPAGETGGFDVGESGGGLLTIGDQQRAGTCAIKLYRTGTGE